MRQLWLRQPPAVWGRCTQSLASTCLLSGQLNLNVSRFRLFVRARLRLTEKPATSSDSASWWGDPSPSRSRLTGSHSSQCSARFHPCTGHLDRPPCSSCPVALPAPERREPRSVLGCTQQSARTCRLPSRAEPCLTLGAACRDRPDPHRRLPRVFSCSDSPRPEWPSAWWSR